MIVQVYGALPSTWETQMTFLATGLILALAVWEVNQQVKDSSSLPSLPPPLIAQLFSYEISKMEGREGGKTFDVTLA